MVGGSCWRKFVGRGATAGLMLAVSALPTQVSASNFGSEGTPGSSGSTNGVFLTDGADWRVARRALVSANSTAVAVAASDYSSTTLNAYVSSPSTCSDAAHDVCVYDAVYSGVGFVGWNACAGTATGGHAGMVCSLDYVRFNQAYTFVPQALACHELGHSVGLRHESYTGSCMYTPSASSSGVLAIHDKDNLNWWYCNVGPC
jgi:predicted Zn-dependent protease